MLAEFEGLREDQQDLLIKAPVFVSILIAGADGKIDKKEMQEAITTARIKQKQARPALAEYYQKVGEIFEEEIKKQIDSLPGGQRERERELESKLRDVNRILPKLPKEFAVQLYASLKDFAKKVAESSGGIFGYLSVGYEESRYVDLKMIQDPSS